MINVRVSTCAPNWPWIRQLPNENGIWGDIRFHVNNDHETCDVWVIFESIDKTQTSICPRENTIFITGEPDGIGNYSEEFLSQFNWVVTCRSDIKHPNIIKFQQGHPWFVEKTYNQLIKMDPVPKQKEICAIISNKSFTKGHQERLGFVEALKDHFGDLIDVYGRGINDFDSKWDVLAKYKYTVVVENYSTDDWLTEKLPDALLAFCYPIYYGCTNLNRYLADPPCLEINIKNINSAIENVDNIVTDRTHYERNLPKICKARKQYLNQIQFFANLKEIIHRKIEISESKPKKITIKPLVQYKKPHLKFSLHNAFNFIKKWGSM